MRVDDVLNKRTRVFTEPEALQVDIHQLLRGKRCRAIITGGEVGSSDFFVPEREAGPMEPDPGRLERRPHRLTVVGTVEHCLDPAVVLISSGIDIALPAVAEKEE